uniref:Uncharacterized protein n=1 Tax=Tanacetum cinerariifolium TaxID=118510 RepID=A0A699KT61_TANCI|nr:hypothetical protein [Tanacetum cinerariifolium]
MLNNLQTNTTSALHNSIMEAGRKDCPPMLAPARVKETYATVSEGIRKKMDAEAEAVHIILIGIDYDIYSIVDACPNDKEMCKVNV